MARVAKVSRSTVSAILRSHPDDCPFDEGAKSRVLQAVQQLNYRPHMAAAALRSGRTRDLALVVPNYEAITHTIQARIFEGAGSRAQELGYTLSVCTYDEKSPIRNSFSELMRESRFDGALLYGLHANQHANQHDDRETVLSDLRVPHIVLEKDSLESASINFNNVAGGRIATEHLLAAGRKRIAFFGYDHSTPYTNRCEGYRQALEAAGVHVDPALILRRQGKFDGTVHYMEALARSGRQAVDALIQDGVAFDAVLACTDEVALGAMQQLARHGRRTPADVAVIGFDASPASGLSIPPLASVFHDATTMGRQAIDMLDRMLRNAPKNRSEFEHRIIEPKLIVRESAPGSSAPGSDFPAVNSQRS